MVTYMLFPIDARAIIPFFSPNILPLWGITFGIPHNAIFAATISHILNGRATDGHVSVGMLFPLRHQNENGAAKAAGPEWQDHREVLPLRSDGISFVYFGRQRVYGDTRFNMVDATVERSQLIEREDIPFATKLLLGLLTGLPAREAGSGVKPLGQAERQKWVHGAVAVSGFTD